MTRRRPTGLSSGTRPACSRRSTPASKSARTARSANCVRRPPTPRSQVIPRKKSSGASALTSRSRCSVSSASCAHYGRDWGRSMGYSTPRAIPMRQGLRSSSGTVASSRLSWKHQGLVGMTTGRQSKRRLRYPTGGKVCVHGSHAIPSRSLAMRSRYRSRRIRRHTMPTG